MRAPCCGVDNVDDFAAALVPRLDGGLLSIHHLLDVVRCHSPYPQNNNPYESKVRDLFGVATSKSAKIGKDRLRSFRPCYDDVRSAGVRCDSHTESTPAEDPSPLCGDALHAVRWREKRRAPQRR